MTFEEWLETKGLGYGGYSREYMQEAWDAATTVAEWQPIETAPTDGTWILLTGGNVDLEWCSKDRPPVVVGQYATSAVPHCAGEWQFAWYDCGFYGEYVKPTHWMSLPTRWYGVREREPAVPVKALAPGVVPREQRRSGRERRSYEFVGWPGKFDRRNWRRRWEDGVFADELGGVSTDEGEP